VSPLAAILLSQAAAALLMLGIVIGIVYMGRR
jgi:hypothetical protein